MAQCLSRSMRRSTTRTILSLLSDSKCLIQQPLLHTNLPEDKNLSFLSLHPNLCSRRSYMTEMRKTILENNIPRLLSNEIQYELERFTPPEPIHEYDAFTVDEKPGEQWIRLNRKFESEEINVEVSMFDWVLPAKKTRHSMTYDDMKPRINVIVDICKGDGNSVLEFVCSAWSDSVEIKNCFVRAHERMKGLPYLGPIFKDLDDSLQDSLYDYLKRRGINDELAGFLHWYIRNKDKSEYLRWMGNVQDFIGYK